MMGSNSPDFMTAYVLANEMLVKSEAIQTFPFSIKEFLREETDITCHSFMEAEKYRSDITALGSESAMLISKAKRYIIFYNANEPYYRIRFSIAHEAGHYFLEHKFNAEGDVYDRQEIEANYFAAQLLMPEQLLLEANRRGISLTSSFIMKSFGVSLEAAQKRVSTLQKVKAEWRNEEERVFDDIIEKKYATFLEKIAPKTYEYYDDLAKELERQKERDSWL